MIEIKMLGLHRYSTLLVISGMSLMELSMVPLMCSHTSQTLTDAETTSHRLGLQEKIGPIGKIIMILLAVLMTD